MKTHQPEFLHSAAPTALLPRVPGGTAPAWRWLLAAGCVALIGPAARAQSNEMAIGVRTEVVDKPDGIRAEPAPEHGKLYGMLPPQPVASEEKLVRPVDPNLLAGLVVTELDKRGFHRVVRGQKPQIIIGMYYGRGWLRNPYMAGAGPETPGGASSVGGIDAPTVTITGTGAQMFKEKGTGFEAKLQRAQYEKLYIRVTAWQYPTDPKVKPKELWHTTMVVDDPDHRDLNAVAAEMLAAGSAFFDRESKEEEVEVYKPVPEGRVYVGTPEVVNTPPKSK